MSGYDTYLEECPYCKNESCQADWVDVGIGLVQCGPFYCDNCGASEIGSYDDLGFDRGLWDDLIKDYFELDPNESSRIIRERRENFILPEGARVTKEELLLGWYGPGQPVSNLANTLNGNLVNHKEAKELYNLGLLDEQRKY